MAIRDSRRWFVKCACLKRPRTPVGTALNSRRGRRAPLNFVLRRNRTSGVTVLVPARGPGIRALEAGTESVARVVGVTYSGGPASDRIAFANLRDVAPSFQVCQSTAASRKKYVSLDRQF